MARFGDYETTRELAVRGLTSVFVAQRVAGKGASTAVIKVLQLPASLTEDQSRPVAPLAPVAPVQPADTSQANMGGEGQAGAGGHAVFVSYSTHDKEAADAVCAALEGAGIRCWIAPRDILPGDNWASSILKAIADSQAMVLVFSSRANGSPHIRREVERAVHHALPIAPLRIEDVMPRDDMEYFLSASHWMDAIIPPIDQHLGLFAGRVQQMLKRQGDAEDALLAGGSSPEGAFKPPTLGASVAARPAATAAAGNLGSVSAAGPVSTARAAVAQFIDAARVQQQAAASSPHWVPVYDLGETPGGAFYAAARFGRTIEHLVESRARLSDENLHRLVTQVLTALKDLRAALDRPHGDLKPSNVLLPGDRLDATSVVALADPLPSVQLSPGQDSTGDLRSIGRLIVWLVAGRSDDETIAWPIQPGPAWDELGATGARWRTLANLLLDPRPPADLGLDEASRQVEALCPHRRRRRVPLAVGAVLALAAAVGVCSWLYLSGALGGRPGHAPTREAQGSPPPLVTAPAGPGPGPSGSASVQRPVGSGDQAVSSAVNTGQSPSTAPSADRSLLEGLMAARNPKAPFKIGVVPHIASCDREDESGPCVSFTVSSDRDCHILLLARDPAGEVGLLLPNTQMDHCLQMSAGSIDLPPKGGAYWFPITAPFGRTTIKVIATTRLIQLVESNPKPGKGSATSSTRPALAGGLSAICLAGLPHEAKDLNQLLDSNEWATAEVDMMTTPPGAAAPAEASGGPAAAGPGSTRLSGSP